MSKSWRTVIWPTWTQSKLKAGEYWMPCSDKTKRTISIKCIGTFRIMEYSRSPRCLEISQINHPEKCKRNQMWRPASLLDYILAPNAATLNSWMHNRIAPKCHWISWPKRAVFRIRILGDLVISMMKVKLTSGKPQDGDLKSIYQERKRLLSVKLRRTKKSMNNDKHICILVYKWQGTTTNPDCQNSRSSQWTKCQKPWRWNRLD